MRDQELLTVVLRFDELTKVTEVIWILAEMRPLPGMVLLSSSREFPDTQNGSSSGKRNNTRLAASMKTMTPPEAAHSTREPICEPETRAQEPWAFWGGVSGISKCGDRMEQHCCGW